jgi:hypothetical protein
LIFEVFSFNSGVEAKEIKDPNSKIKDHSIKIKLKKGVIQIEPRRKVF